ncbi:flagellar hook-length control protein FliK [Sinanaerobacter sp. ZZT-01]|uniref:flagellar hook-length control protein FliK n=1 Tax=Sinanaerobacter sp. ZZT-01 TaxID=3111540 RepID=UPI002D78CD35|nr:flagellar hook-length control protein FliK [Sinanaerobacter sp. ZZT-01]WRR93605.1 flagellar hook-length control protein FliK [Sinanaerobacter sp. ZZT-01]
MYAANNLAQVQSFNTKAKTDVKSKMAEKDSGFDQSFAYALKENLTQNQSSSVEKKELVPLKETSEQQDETSLMETGLANDQAAMAMLVLNADDTYLANQEQADVSTALLQENVSDVKGTLTQEMSFAADEAKPFDGKAAYSEILGNANTLLKENPLESKQIGAPIKDMTQANGLEQTVKTEVASQQLNEAGKIDLAGKSSDLTGLKNETLRTDKEGLSPTQKGTEREEELPEILTGASVKKEEPLDFTKVNIKVAENTTEADSNFLSKDLAEKILHRASEGKNVFEVQLTPEELGSIQIKLTFEAGKASVLLNCSNPKTQEILMGQSENIRQIIEQQTGLETIVAVKEDAYTKQQDFDGRGQNNRREEQKNQSQRDDSVNAEQFMQQLRLGLVGKEDLNYGFS